MTATDELRRMLDERGVEWWDESIVMFGGGVDFFTLYGGTHQHPAVVYSEGSNGTRLLIVPDLTPEQAVEATLGREECTRVMDSIDPFGMWVCDHCGHPLNTSENFCGGCGRKVKR